MPSSEGSGCRHEKLQGICQAFGSFLGHDCLLLAQVHAIGQAIAGLPAQQLSDYQPAVSVVAR
jgi:hypothetical protein